jgi:hypothetical protein
MANLGPQQFEIPISDQLFQTLNPADPIIGIAADAHVPVTIPWNKERTALAKGKGNQDKEVVFGKTKWIGAGPGPHDVFEEQLGGQRVKVGKVSWSIDTEVYQDWVQQGAVKRLRVTPCPILTRTYTSLQGASDDHVVAKNPQPCYGKWVPV